MATHIRQTINFSNTLPRTQFSSCSARPFDYLYDPCCVLSSANDHAREARLALHSTCDQGISLKFVPIYRRMFSELPNYPAGVLKLQDRRPIPWFISRRYRRVEESETKVGVHPLTNRIDGPDLVNFFRKPRMNVQAGHIASMLFKMDNRARHSRDKEEEEESVFGSVTQGTQTDYRESEAQTDPYTPNFHIYGNSEPEILTLASLSWGKGLPVGEAEIVMIERARMKRALEASLPPLTKENLTKRLRKIAAIEWQEWMYREQEIQDIHDMKLVLTKQLLKNEDENFTKSSVLNMTRLWKLKENEKFKMVKTLEKLNRRSKQRLAEKRKALTKKFSKQNRIDLHLDPGSEIYAPLLRNGLAPMRCRKTTQVQCRFLNSYKEILYLEKFLSEEYFEVKPKQPILPKLPEKGYVQRKYKSTRQLDEAYKSMLEQRKISSDLRSRVGSATLMEKLEKPPPRPVTPEVVGPTQLEDEIEQSVIFLQKVLRGRAIQILMHEGKERCADLIEDLRQSHALYSQEQKHLDDARAQLQRNTEEHLKNDKREEELNSMIESFVGEGASQMLDFLSKELIRLQDERRIHALAMLAERQRRIREAEESGLRQVEERRRREEQEVFREILNTHQQSIDQYLEDVVAGSVHQTADNEARKEIEAMARRINDVAHALEEQRDVIQSEEMVAELVHSFLLPEVERMSVRESVRRKQDASLKAAHQFIYDGIKPPTPSAVKLNVKLRMGGKWTKKGKIRKPEISSRPSNQTLDDWHRFDALEEWDVYLPGQLRYGQMRSFTERETIVEEVTDPSNDSNQVVQSTVSSRDEVSSRKRSACSVKRAGPDPDDYSCE